MYRLSAIALLCLAFSIPALATDEAENVEDVDVSFELGTPSEASPEVQGLEDLPPEVLERIDSEQIAEILESREDSRVALAALNSPASYLVPFGVPFAFFLTILVSLTAALVFRHRKHAQLQETLRLMIEKGADIPPELIAPPAAPYGDLRRGLVLVGAGLSLLILVGLVFGFGTGSWAVGLIPAFIGAGYLIVWRISRRTESG